MALIPDEDRVSCLILEAWPKLSNSEPAKVRSNVAASGSHSDVTSSRRTRALCEIVSEYIEYDESWSWCRGTYARLNACAEQLPTEHVVPHRPAGSPARTGRFSGRAVPYLIQKRRWIQPEAAAGMRRQPIGAVGAPQPTTAQVRAEYAALTAGKSLLDFSRSNTGVLLPSHVLALTCR